MEKKHKKMIITLTVIIVSLTLISLGFIFYVTYNQKHWDGGKWGTSYLIGKKDQSYRLPLFLEYKDRLYCFTSIETKDTYDGNDCITSGEYSLYDIVYKYYEDGSWSDETLLTNAHDEISETIEQAIVFNDSVFLLQRISEYNLTAMNWDSRWSVDVRLKEFDGTDWKDHGSIMGEKKSECHGYISMINNRNLLYLFWKDDAYYENVEMSFKTYDGDTWSPKASMEIDTNGIVGQKFVVFKDQIWMTWSSKNNDIMLGRFNGDNFDDIRKMSQDHEDFRCRPDIAIFKDCIYVSWESGDIQFRTYNGSTLGKIYKLGFGYQVDSIVFKDKIYFIWMSMGFLDLSSHNIRSYDGETLSKTFRTDKKYESSDYPMMAVFDNKIFVYWETYLKHEITYAIREYTK